jgi:hypothetical protein
MIGIQNQINPVPDGFKEAQAQVAVDMELAREVETLRRAEQLKEMKAAALKEFAASEEESLAVVE